MSAICWPSRRGRTPGRARRLPCRSIAESNALRRATLEELKDTRGRARRKALRETIAQMPPFRRITGPTTRKHIRATLRSALNTAITQELITFNPAAHVEMDPAKRPKPLVWTAARLDRYRKTGERPSPVMVWTPEQTGEFLDYIADDAFYELFHLIAYCGLRRGEACGLRWVDVDFRDSTITIATQLTWLNGEIIDSAPKSDAGEHVVALDGDSRAVLKTRKARQARHQLP